MSYYARVTVNEDFLMHINYNRDPESGQFISAGGDGDRDGYVDDNHNKEHRKAMSGNKSNSGNKKVQSSIAVSNKSNSGDKKDQTDIAVSEKNNSEDKKDQTAIAVSKYNVLSGSIQKTSSRGQEALKAIYGDNAYYRKYNIDFSQMTDQEMQSAINRYMLEQRYNDAFNPKVKNESYANAEKFVSAVGTAAATAATIIGLYNAVQGVRSLKGK